MRRPSNPHFSAACLDGIGAAMGMGMAGRIATVIACQAGRITAYRLSAVSARLPAAR
jgi:hypothetical protein